MSAKELSIQSRSHEEPLLGTATKKTKKAAAGTSKPTSLSSSSSSSSAPKKSEAKNATLKATKAPVIPKLKGDVSPKRAPKTGTVDRPALQSKLPAVANQQQQQQQQQQQPRQRTSSQGSLVDMVAGLTIARQRTSSQSSLGEGRQRTSSQGSLTEIQGRQRTSSQGSMGGIAQHRKPAQGSIKDKGDTDVRVGHKQEQQEQEQENSVFAAKEEEDEIDVSAYDNDEFESPCSSDAEEAMEAVNGDDDNVEADDDGGIDGSDRGDDSGDNDDDAVDDKTPCGDRYSKSLDCVTFVRALTEERVNFTAVPEAVTSKAGTSKHVTRGAAAGKAVTSVSVSEDPDKL